MSNAVIIIERKYIYPEMLGRTYNPSIGRVGVGEKAG
jgi:hypothetical protein